MSKVVIAKCQCKDCTNEGTVKLTLKNRGNRPAYVCEYHAKYEDSYYSENEYRQGKRKMNGYTFGVELETSYSNLDARIELFNHGFLATEDCTVDVEYKSPIYEGLNSLIKQCNSIEMLINEGKLEIDNTCGTHFHVGHVDYINRNTIDYIGNYYHALFGLLSDTLVAENDRLTPMVYGRRIEEFSWAEPINKYSNAYNHSNFINLEHNHTLEFRLCKFTSAKQYKNLIRLNKAMTDCIIKNFLSHYNDDCKNETYAKVVRAGGIEAYRHHKAIVTSKKLVKLFYKYANNL